jgi:hypothetical protein
MQACAFTDDNMDFELKACMILVGAVGASMVCDGIKAVYN